ncbi:hypothetical protein LCGC14_2208500 [marine sediment metagenome]|uniref:Uncharacterized protein n=1 Tax=marine sediment metagenome TaxID=412755 RepID=A0A0F9GAD3_9ZZZZ
MKFSDIHNLVEQIEFEVENFRNKVTDSYDTYSIQNLI